MQHSSRKWHAVYTRPKCEKKVAAQLTRKRITHYYPINTIQKESNERNQSVSEPLFSSIVFVYVNPIEQLEVSKTSGVINFMYWLNRPAVINEAEIEEIRKILNGFSGIQLRKTSVRPGEEIKFSSKSLTLREGNIMEVSPNMFSVSLPSLGYILEAEVKREEHAIINSLSMSTIYSKIKLSLLS